MSAREKILAGIPHHPLRISTLFITFVSESQHLPTLWHHLGYYILCPKRPLSWLHSRVFFSLSPPFRFAGNRPPPPPPSLPPKSKKPSRHNYPQPHSPVIN